MLAIAAEIKKRSSKNRVIYIAQKNDQLIEIITKNANIDQVYSISAGKLRRYKSEGLKQIFYLKTQFLNIRDVYRTLKGLFQSYFIIKKEQPDIIFTRGGFISVPVALAGKLKRVMFLTHDSDSSIALSNKLIARYAVKNLVNSDIDNYPAYPKDKVIKVGIPLRPEFEQVSKDQKEAYKKELGLSEFDKIICVTGGGNGAAKLNETIYHNINRILDSYPNLAIINFSGIKLANKLSLSYDELLSPQDRRRVFVYGFKEDLYKYSAISDIVICRGGATNNAEFAAQGLACIIIPTKQLSWNVKNAQVLAKKKAVISLDEDDIFNNYKLSEVIAGLLNDQEQLEALRKNLLTTYVPNSTQIIVDLIIKLTNP